MLFFSSDVFQPQPCARRALSLLKLTIYWMLSKLDTVVYKEIIKVGGRNNDYTNYRYWCFI